MKNLGVFSPNNIDINELKELGSSLGGKQIGESTLRFGEIPEEAYLELSTDLSDGCFDYEELQILQSQLGYTPAAYISVHMNYTQAAFHRAILVANAIRKRWGGDVDYSGVTGDVDHPFQSPEKSRKDLS